MNNHLTTSSPWEEAVLWLREQSDQESLVRNCYYDESVNDAAKRFAVSEEWEATRDLLEPYLPTKVLDLGAGRGIASYAFSQEGCRVTALEPDSGSIVGAGAIRSLQQDGGADIEVVQGTAEDLPFGSNSFGIVYARAAFHHARDIRQLCREAARVLRPGGVFLAVREHVISRRADLGRFQQEHPLHARYGGEHAYLLAEYREAVVAAGLKLRTVFGPYDTVINYWPLTTEALHEMIAARLARLVGGRIAHGIVACSEMVQFLGSRLLSCLSSVPGRHYAFFGIKE